MRLWGMKPYRCRECQTRFYLPSELGSKIAADRAWMHDVTDDRNSHRPRAGR